MNDDVKTNDRIIDQLEADKNTMYRILDGWDKDATITDKEKASPQDVMAGIGKLHAKYLRILSTHKLNADIVQKEFAKLRKLRAAYYDGSISKEDLDYYNWEPYLGPAPKIKTQMETLLEGDEYLSAVMQRKAIYEQIVENCQSIIKEINNRTWQLRSFIQFELAIRNP